MFSQKHTFWQFRFHFIAVGVVASLGSLLSLRLDSIAIEMLVQWLSAAGKNTQEVRLVVFAVLAFLLWATTFLLFSKLLKIDTEKLLVSKPYFALILVLVFGVTVILMLAYSTSFFVYSEYRISRLFNLE